MCKAYRPRAPRRHAADPLGRAADVVGDRWSILVVSDLADAPATYGDLQRRLVGISTNALAERLQALVEAGVVRRVSARMLAPRGGYALTPKGRALLPVAEEMRRWAETYRPLRPRRRPVAVGLAPRVSEARDAPDA